MLANWSILLVKNSVVDPVWFFSAPVPTFWREFRLRILHEFFFICESVSASRDLHGKLALYSWRRFITTIRYRYLYEVF